MERDTWNMDEIDAKIIRLLDQNSRRPATDIANAVHVSATTVKSRIDTMMRAKVIHKFSVEVDLQKTCGTDCLHAIIFVHLNADEIKHATRELCTMASECRYVRKHYKTYGSIDEFVLVVDAINERAYNGVLRQLNELSGVKSVRGVLLSHRKECHAISDILPGA